VVQEEVGGPIAFRDAVLQKGGVRGIDAQGVAVASNYVDDIGEGERSGAFAAEPVGVGEIPLTERGIVGVSSEDWRVGDGVDCSETEAEQCQHQPFNAYTSFHSCLLDKKIERVSHSRMHPR
jgi:hypothetical protein